MAEESKFISNVTFGPREGHQVLDPLDFAIVCDVEDWHPEGAPKADLAAWCKPQKVCGCKPRKLFVLSCNDCWKRLCEGRDPLQPGIVRCAECGTTYRFLDNVIRWTPL